MNTLDDKTRAAYRYWRAIGKAAAIALQCAQDDVMAGKVRYTPCRHGYSGASFKAHRSNHARWIESPRDAGLRLVGFADEVAPRLIDHHGWYTRDDCGETLRGVVYQMAARDGCARYVPGYADPHNAGAVLLSFDPSDIETGERGGNGDRYGDNDSQSMRDAAARADRIAELCAEHEREYHRAWDAGDRFAVLAEEAQQLRAKARQTIRDAKGATLPPTICDLLREHLAATLERLQSIRAQRAALLRGEGASWLHWDTRNASHRDAFNDAAGIAC